MVSPKFQSAVVAISFGSTIICFILFASSSLVRPAIAKPIAVQKGPDTAIIELSAELIATLEKQAEAWNRGDLAEFMLPYWKNERLTFSSGGKTKRGWQQTFENYKSSYPNREIMGKLTFSKLETEELGPDAMLMLGVWELDRADPVGGNFSLVWKRIDGRWLIIHDHSSALRP